jgi:putative methionine-R-sulfoxide reductase with GAF domain
MRQPSLLDQLGEAALSQGARSLRAQKAADVIRRGRAYRWVGIYEVEGENLALVAWSGFGDHPDDVPVKLERLYATASRAGAVAPAGGSQVVVPIVEGNAVIGVIDVVREPSPSPSGSDRAVLEGCASVLAALWADRERTPTASSDH